MKLTVIVIFVAIFASSVLGVDYKGDYNGDYKGDYKGDHNGDYKGDHNGDYKGDYKDDYKGDYKDDYNGDHNGDYKGDYHGDYKGDYHGGGYKDCKDFYLDYGDCKISWTRYGKIAKCYCHDGYSLYGDSVLKCHDGYWRASRRSPQCKKKYHDGKSCAPPKDPEYGYCKVHGSSVTYYCNDGYDLYGGDRVRNCHDGYWGGREPRCRRKHSYITRCGYLDALDYGYVKSDGREVGCIAKYRCRKGYKLYGNSIRKCLYSGYWSGHKPVCKRVKRCPRLYHPSYGKVFIKDHYGYSYDYSSTSTAIYKCDYGYWLIGNKKRVCRHGYWTGYAPRCVSKKRY